MPKAMSMVKCALFCGCREEVCVCLFLFFVLVFSPFFGGGGILAYPFCITESFKEVLYIYVLIRYVPLHMFSV